MTRTSRSAGPNPNPWRPWRLGGLGDPPDPDRPRRAACRVRRLEDLPSPLVYAYALLLGLFGGSFLNVVIHRLPREMSIVRPPSHCPACGAKVRWFDNIPVLSYLVLGGRARCCK